MKANFDYLVRGLTDWLFRRKSPWLTVMRIGLSLVTAGIALGWKFDVSFPVSDGEFSLAIDNGGGTPAVLTYSVTIVGLILVIGSVILQSRRDHEEQRRLSRKKVLVVEGRGLREMPGNPLIEAIPTEIEGHRDPILLELRQKVEDGRIFDPAPLAEKVETLVTQIEQRTGGLNRSDISLVYGGLAPVPLTFLTGVVMDDEGKVIVFDWDRGQKCWRRLDGADDEKRFESKGLEEIEGKTEVVLAISVSYPILKTDLADTFGSLPVVRLTLKDGSPNSHWSEAKQIQLADQFFRTAIDLSGRGVKRIHLVLAAPNSVVFQFGQAYDKRNLPEIVVYQFEKGSTPPYPWGVLMPVGGIRRASITRTNQNAMA